MTELTCVAATMRLDDPGPPESVGRLMPNTEARIVDPESGRDLSANETGEIWIRGPQMMAGYRDRPQATAETVDNEGWIHTGDLGRIDDNGYLFVDDRIKDLIKSKGFQVAPAELEGILTSHPSVRDAAVTSVEDDGDELPVAFVVAANGDIDPDQVRAWVAEQVSSYKRLADLHVVEVIPRNVNGKILRRQLKESLQQ
jgi:acyl-CoA synthetase (AMP-forming)/AMP-acid ligase II